MISRELTPLRLLYMGSPEVAVTPLRQLLELSQEIPHKFEIIGVVSQPAKPRGRGKKLEDPPVAEVAKGLGLRVMQPENAKEELFLNEVSQLKPDFAITVSYGQILNDRFLGIPRYGTLNIHPSLLPKYRGATPVQSALLQGDFVTGVSLVKTVRKLDAGPILEQVTVPIEAQEVAGSLLERLITLGGKTLVDWLKRFIAEDGRICEAVQDESQVTLCSKFSKEDGQINWHEPAELICRKFRAFKPWPGSYTFIPVKGETLKRIMIEELALGDVSNLNADLAPGVFVYAKDKRVLLIGTGDSKVLTISALKPEGKPQQSAFDFINGLKSDRNFIYKT